MNLRQLLCCCGVVLFASVATAQDKLEKYFLHHMDATQSSDFNPSPAYQWLDIMLDIAADDVERIGARPTILSRQMGICVTAMYDAWAPYDETAVGTQFGGALRRPAAERTEKNKATAIAYAMYRAMLDQYPDFAEKSRAKLREMGYDPDNASLDTTTPEGIGNAAAQAVLEYRHTDGANQFGDEIGSNGKPYSDYTMYKCVNENDKVYNADCWQRLPFADGKGGYFYPDFLTPQWYRVKPFALESSAQFRPPPVPKWDSEQMKKEVDEVIFYNANLTVEQKAIVEFMRDGPRSTGQSGHWLRFAQDISRRDKNDIDKDVKLFFSIGNTCMDAFIACWEAKRFYDSSRPWTLVREIYKGKTIRGWAGPGSGVKDIPAEKWHPYSPANFVSPPFPAYPSGHSTVSGASAEMLKLFTGSDRYEAVAQRDAGSLTEEGFECEHMQMIDGKIPELKPGEKLSCEVHLRLPTFSETAELAGISRIMGGYHIQSDNVEGLTLGRKVAQYSWPIYQSYFDGTAKVEPRAKMAGAN